VLPHDRKCCALLGAGADVVVTAEATAEMLAMRARQFVEEIIVRRFGPLHVVEGRDFHFGAKRGGDVSLLNLMGCQYGFALHVVEAVMFDAPDGAVRITSTLIRKLVAAGDVDAAARCLGRPYAIYGTIIAGQGKGRLMDFPTANISAGEQVVPADGVYAGRAEIDGRQYPAAISVGHKPTLGPTSDLYIEAFLLGMNRGTGVPPVRGDFYGRTMELSFLRRLRAQERFADADALRQQIAKDVAAVREIVRSL
jgi:riboflavin kinase/FMN adenylyltransferase